MRMSNNFFITRKEFPNDEDCISAKLLIKSGMIYKNDNGIYSYLPIGLKVLENIKRIIREEMKKKWKKLQMKFSSNTPFGISSYTLESFVGGYVKR